MKHTLSDIQQAGFFKRAGAWLYDGFVISAILMLVGAIIMGIVSLLAYSQLISLEGYADTSAYLTMHPRASLIYTASLGTSIIGFYSYFWCTAGQTLGMRAWGLRLQNADGSRIRFTQALIRMGTSAFGLGNLMALMTEKNRSFQDLMAECEMVNLKSTPAKK